MIVAARIVKRELWKLSRAVRGSIKLRMRHLQDRISAGQDRVAELEPWLANVKRILEADQKELKKLKEEFV